MLGIVNTQDGEDKDNQYRTAIMIIVIVCLVIVILVAITIITWAGLKNHYKLHIATFEHNHPGNQSSRDHPDTMSFSAYVPMISADSPTVPQELKFP